MRSLLFHSIPYPYTVSYAPFTHSYTPPSMLLHKFADVGPLYMSRTNTPDPRLILASPGSISPIRMSPQICMLGAIRAFSCVLFSLPCYFIVRTVCLGITKTRVIFVSIPMALCEMSAYVEPMFVLYDCLGLIPTFFLLMYPAFAHNPRARLPGVIKLFSHLPQLQTYHMLLPQHYFYAHGSWSLHRILYIYSTEASVR